MGKTHLLETLRALHYQTTHGFLPLPDVDGASEGGDRCGGGEVVVRRRSSGDHRKRSPLVEFESGSSEGAPPSSDPPLCRLSNGSVSSCTSRSTDPDDDSSSARMRGSQGSLTSEVEVSSSFFGEAVGGQMCFLINTAKPIESTTPFFMWRAIFERLFTTQALKQLSKVSRGSSWLHGGLG